MFTKDLKLKVLKGALDVLDGGKNWIKGNYRQGDKFCLAGAMFESARREGLVTEILIDDDYDPYVEYADSVFGLTTHEEMGTIADTYTRESSLSKLVEERGFVHVPDFNDNTNTTYADIEALVRERIAMIESEETDDGASNTA